MTARKFINYSELENDVQELIRESIEARKMSYSPYSNFPVGAALRCTDLSIIRGCNVENSSFPVGTCAERVAMTKAISDGKRKFVALAVAADLVDNVITSPCGMCRQFLNEFGNFPVYLTSPCMKKILETSVSDLLPLSFKFNDN